MKHANIPIWFINKRCHELEKKMTDEMTTDETDMSYVGKLANEVICLMDLVTSWQERELNDETSDI